MASSAGEASADELLARALEVIDWQSARIDELARQNAAAAAREQNAQLVRVNEELRELVGDQAARLAEANESLAALQRHGVRPEIGEEPPGAACRRGRGR